LIYAQLSYLLPILMIIM